MIYNVNEHNDGAGKSAGAKSNGNLHKLQKLSNDLARQES